MMKLQFNEEEKLEHLNLRVFPSVRNLIKELVDKYPEKYNNESEFIRIALNHYLKNKFNIEMEV